MTTEMITAIRNIVELDMAAVEAYSLAIRVCVTEELKKQLDSFRSDHERHVDELSEWLRSQGEEPPAGLEEAGETILAYTAMSSLEDRSAILAMRGNEELTNGTYASALRAELPDDLRQIVLR